MMQNLLFDRISADCNLNLLPKDGRVHYQPGIFDGASCIHLLSSLQNSLLWESDQLLMFGRTIITRRKVAWVGDLGCSYTYSGIQKHPQAWTPELLLIKAKLEELTQSEFNSCLLNLYYDGSDGMGWHSDDEKELDAKAPIVSFSIGAVRKFAFRHKKDKTTLSLFLENGSLLVMHTPTQQYWQHSLLKTKIVTAPRINLTFRKIIPNHE
jgi:alkylated DNA repair dioxygenase AlkB